MPLSTSRVMTSDLRPGHIIVDETRRRPDAMIIAVYDSPAPASYEKNMSTVVVYCDFGTTNLVHARTWGASIWSIYTERL